MTNGGGDGRWKVAGASIVLLLIVASVLSFRALGESRRIDQANKAQDARISQNFAKIEKDIRADCRFKLDVASLPAVAKKNHQPLTPTLVTLARDARHAFIAKGCPGAIDEQTGKRYGNPPEIP